MRCFLLVGLLLMVAGCIADGRLSTDNPDLATCRTWLEKNLDDPHWDEVGFEELREADGETLYEFRIRTRVPEGGKAIKKYWFWVSDGEVTNAQVVN